MVLQGHRIHASSSDLTVSHIGRHRARRAGGLRRAVDRRAHRSLRAAWSRVDQRGHRPAGDGRVAHARVPAAPSVEHGRTRDRAAAGVRRRAVAGDRPAAPFAALAQRVRRDATRGGRDLGGDRATCRAAPTAIAIGRSCLPSLRLPRTRRRRRGPSWFIGAFDLERGTDRLSRRGCEFAAGSWRPSGRRRATSHRRAIFRSSSGSAAFSGPNTIHYAMKGRGQLDPEAGRIEAAALEFRGWAGGDPLPLAGVELKGALKRATYESGNGLATLDSGTFNLAGIPGHIRRQARPRRAGARRRAARQDRALRAARARGQLRPPLPVTTDPAAFESLQVALVAEAHAGRRTALDPVTGRLDDTNFEGRIVPGKRLVRAKLDRIDLNRYVAPDVKRRLARKGDARGVRRASSRLRPRRRDPHRRGAGRRARTLRDTVIRVERNGETGP